MLECCPGLSDWYSPVLRIKNVLNVCLFLRLPVRKIIRFGMAVHIMQERCNKGQ